MNMYKRDVDKLVEWVIAEDDGGGWGGGGWGDDMGFHGAYGGPSGGLYKTFLQPFVDVWDTAKSVAETGMSKVQLLTGIVTYGVMSSLLPFVTANYEEMVQHDKRRMSKIQSKYKEVLERTDEALTSVGGDYDGAGLFFVMFPAQVMARNLVKNMGSMGEDAAKMAADTAFDFLDAVTMNATGAVTDPLRKKLGFTESTSRYDDRMLLFEEDQPKGIAKAVVKVFTHPKIEEKLTNSKVLSSMRQDAVEAVEGTIRDALVPIKKLKAVQTVDELERLTGKPVNLDEALKAKDVDPSTVSDRELDAAMKDVLPALVEQAAQPFVKRFESLRDSMKKMASKYDVAGTETFKTMISKFDEALKALEE